MVKTQHYNLVTRVTGVENKWPVRKTDLVYAVTTQQPHVLTTWIESADFHSLLQGSDLIFTEKKSYESTAYSKHCKCGNYCCLKCNGFR